MLDILILQKNIQKELKKLTKSIAEKLDFDEIEFPVQEKHFIKIEAKNNICINVFGYGKGLLFPIYASDQEFEDSVELLPLTDYDKYIMCALKVLLDLCFTKQKNKNKKWVGRSCLQCFSSESVWIKHKENCLSINGKQSVKLEKGIMEFEKYFKQIPVPFKIYADFECNLRGFESLEGSCKKKISRSHSL